MTTPRVTVPVDTFNGDNVALAASISALLEAPDASLSARVPGMAKQLLASAAARLSAAPAPEGGAVAMIKALLDHIDRETCQHDNLKRGGFQWTICEDCDRKWADDQGGFKPYADAPPVAAARLYLEALAAQPPAREGEGQ